MNRTFPCLRPLAVALAAAVLLAPAWASARLAKFIERLDQHQTEQERIVFFGTSLTAGGDWPTQLRLALEDRYGKDSSGSSIRYKRVGLSGKASNTALQNINNVLAENPTVVFIEFATNDSFQYPDATNVDYGISVEKSKENLATIIQTLRAANPDVEIIVQTMNPAWNSPTGSNQSATLRPHLADYFQGYREVAEQQKVDLIDHYPNWLKLQQDKPDTFEKYVPDGVHPTADGYRDVVTPVILASILPEPATLSVLAVSGTLLLRRRARHSSTR